MIELLLNRRTLLSEIVQKSTIAFHVLFTFAGRALGARLPGPGRMAYTRPRSSSPTALLEVAGAGTEVGCDLEDLSGVGRARFVRADSVRYGCC